jgi:uncharacterized protein (DUF1778 family)
MVIPVNQKELISIEISKEDKEKLEKIAILKGITVGEYLLDIARKEAQKIENNLINRKAEMIKALKEDLEDENYQAEIKIWDHVVGDGIDG